MTAPIVAVITGANRGIGKAIAQTLARSSSKPLIIYATSRQGHNLNLQTCSEVQVNYVAVDTTDPSSVEELAKAIQDEHGTVDVVINNAAAHDAGNYTPDVIKTVLDTNVRSTLRVSLASHIQEGFWTEATTDVSDSMLDKYNKQIQERFRDPKLTLQDLEEMLQEYYACVIEGSEKENGWPKSAYSVSKASTNALTAILARENPGLVINCCCPGWVDTDMGSIAGSRPPKSPGDGAKIPIRLGFGDIGGVTGRYWGNPSVADTGDGQVMDW